MMTSSTIHARRRAHSRLGFALQLCVFRYPGRLLNAEDVIPARVIKFIAAQPGMDAVDLDGYANGKGRDESTWQNSVRLCTRCSPVGVRVI